MAITSKSLLLAYNKCADLATKWANILDSFRHKSDKITKEDLAADAMVEIVDTLTSTDTDKALSANQGKVLDAKITALPKHEVGDNSDLDDSILNGLYPIETHPIGSTHTDTNVEWVGVYRRVTATEWMFFQTQEAMQLYFDSRYLQPTATKKYVDENGVALMEVPFNEKINLHGVKAGYDIAKGGYYLESILDAPLIYKIEPLSILPNSSRDILIYGASLTQSTTVTTNNQNININSVIFSFCSLGIPILIVNITSDSVEGSVDFVLNNGKSKEFFNVLLVILGELFLPNSSDWISITGGLDISETGTAKVFNLGTHSSGIWTQVIDHTKAWRIEFSYNKSQQSWVQGYGLETELDLINISDSSLALRSSLNFLSTSVITIIVYGDGNPTLQHNRGTSPTQEESFDNYIDNVKIRYEFSPISNNLSVNVGGVHVESRPVAFSENLLIKVNPKFNDFKNIKYIELATT